MDMMRLLGITSNMTTNKHIVIKIFVVIEYILFTTPPQSQLLMGN